MLTNNLNSLHKGCKEKPTTCGYYPDSKFFSTLLLFIVFSISYAQTISTVAGNGTAGYSGDNGLATSAELKLPFALTLDASGNIYICDYENARIRKVTVSTGIITTIAGNGTAGYNGDNGAATSAEIKLPEGIAADASGNVYIADYGNNRIRKVTISSGIITTIAGTGTAGYSGDDAAATAAKIDQPQGLAFDATGNVYIADAENNRIRKITVSTGFISTIAGTGTAGYTGDGAAATSAKLDYPTGIAFDATGNLYIADQYNNRIREVSAGTGFISTIAGTGSAGYNGDGILATAAKVNYPQEVTIDASGNVYISDVGNSRVRKITAATGIITTVAGDGTAGYNGDGIAATSAELYDVDGVAFDAPGNMYIDDGENNRIRKVTILTPPAQPGSISGTTPVCSAKTQIYSVVSVTGATSYTWTLPSGWSGTSTTNSITVTTGTSGGTISVTANNAAGSSPAQTLAVTINSIPAQPGPISGNTSVAWGQNETYSVPPVSGATSYTWALPSGWSGTSTSNSITASAGDGGTISVTANNSCGSSAASLLIISDPTFVWTGATNTSWAAITNWNPVAPTGGPNSCYADVVIPLVANQPVISTAAGVGNIQINAGVQLTLNANLSVCKNFTGSSTAVAANVTGTGSVILNGSAAQLINGYTSFNELRLNNSAGAQMQTGSSVDIYTALDLQSGTFNATNGTLTFKSTSISQVGIINNFSNGYTGTVTGNIIAERYFEAANVYTQQHQMGSPVNSPLFSQFGSATTGGGAGYIIPGAGCNQLNTAPNSPYGNVFSYHENNLPAAATCGLAEWYVEPSTNTATNGQGYSVLKPGPATLSLTGTPNLNATYSISGMENSTWSNTTLQGNPIKSGWQLVSNPYLASLNISSAPTGFDSQILVWVTNGTGSGSYETLMAGSNALIAPFQAFMVHVSAGNVGTYTYTINATDRTTSRQTFYMQNDNELDITATNLSTGLVDKTTVAFNTNATDTFDTQFDANKSAGSLNRHTLYSVNNNDWMSINTLHDIASTSTVPVGFEPGITGNYSFTFGNINTFDATTYIYLEDLQQHIMYNVRNGNYQFSADSADDWNRFVLHLTPPAVISSTDAGCNSLGVINVTQPGTANWNYTLTDGSNTVIASGALNQNTPININEPAGSYTLTLVDNNNYTVTKQIQLNGAQPVTAAFIPSTTTVTTQTQVSFVNTSQDANSYNWNFGDGATSSLVSPVHTYVASGTYTVELNASNTTGCTSAVNETIKVTNSTTAITPVTDNGITMWSNTDRIYIDFGQLSSVDAKIKVYDVLGQELLNDEFTGSALYQKEIDNTSAACVIVSVKNGGEIITKKLFLISTK